MLLSKKKAIKVSIKEEKYLVIKLVELENYFSQFTKGFFTTETEQKHIDQIPFNTVVKAIGDMREAEGKTRLNDCVVCNRDEPYAEDVLRTILKGEEAKMSFYKNKSESGK